MPTATFDTGLQGWTTTIGTETFASGDGNPGGSLRGVEGGTGTWYFNASAAFLGDQSALYGGTLRFDLRQDGTANQFDDADVLLTGNGITLAYDFGANPGTGWTSYTVGLGFGDGWHIGTLGGRIATQAEILGVLGNLQSLQIRGEFVVGTIGDAANLDNVVTTAGTPDGVHFVGARIESTFNAGIDGWAFLGDVADFRQVGTGGNPGGYLELVDYATGGVCYFVAPEKYLGNKAAFSGGTLDFDLRQSSTANQFNTDDVVIVGNSLTLVLDTNPNPGTDWTHYALTFDTGTAWRVGSATGALATQAQINAVLANLQDLRIRGEFVTGPDTDGLDNVVMAAPSAAVRVFATPAAGGLLSSHASLTSALAVAADGNLITIATLSALGQASYAVNANRLTIQSDLNSAGTLVLNGAADIRLAGKTTLDVTGTAAKNTITGSDGANILDGLGAKDVMSGGGGSDSVNGGAGNDKLAGDAGSDLLVGGAGADRMTGGSGADTFRFNSLGETGLGTASDTITDFVSGTDHISLQSLGLSFIGAAGFTGAGNEVRWDAGLGRLLIDTDGDPAAEHEITVLGNAPLGIGDVLV